MRLDSFEQAPLEDQALKAAFARAPCLMLGRDITAEAFATLKAGFDGDGTLTLCSDAFAKLSVDGIQELSVLFPSSEALYGAAASLSASPLLCQALGRCAMELMKKELMNSGASARRYTKSCVASRAHPLTTCAMFSAGAVPGAASPESPARPKSGKTLKEVVAAIREELGIDGKLPMPKAIALAAEQLDVEFGDAAATLKQRAQLVATALDIVTGWPMACVWIRNHC